MRQEKVTAQVNLFIAYARSDKPILKKLKTHLSPLKRSKIVCQIWDDGEISAGQEWEQQIITHLQQADIILLLVSSYFIDSDYAFGVEMQKALERGRNPKDNVQIIPIIISACLWDSIPEIAKFQVLPRDGKPIISSNWHNEHEAFYEIVKPLMEIAGKIKDAKEKQLAEERRKAELARIKAIFKDYIKEAQALVRNKEWATAQAKWKSALEQHQKGFSPTLTIIKTKIEQCQIELVCEQLLLSFHQTKEAEQYTQALDYLTQIAAHKPADKVVQQHIAELEQLIWAREQAKYQVLIQQAEQFHLRQKWEEAVSLYQQALAIYRIDFKPLKELVKEQKAFCVQMDFFILEQEQTKEQVLQLKGQLKELMQTKHNQAENIIQLNTQLTEWKNKFATSNEQILGLKGELAKMTQAREQLRKDKNNVVHQLKESDQIKAQLEEENAALNKQLKKWQMQSAKLEYSVDTTIVTSLSKLNGQYTINGEDKLRLLRELTPTKLTKITTLTIKNHPSNISLSDLSSLKTLRALTVFDHDKFELLYDLYVLYWLDQRDMIHLEDQVAQLDLQAQLDGLIRFLEEPQDLQIELIYLQNTQDLQDLQAQIIGLGLTYLIDQLNQLNQLDRQDRRDRQDQIGMACMLDLRGLQYQRDQRDKLLQNLQKKDQATITALQKANAFVKEMKQLEAALPNCKMYY